VKLLEELGLPELTDEQIEELCWITEEATRKYVYSKVPSKTIETLNIAAEAEGTKPVKLTVDVDITLSSLMKDFDTQELADESLRRAFASAKEYLGRLACHSQE
jgi:hypothetical protein